MNDYRLSMAAFNGNTVTQGHADYCANNGHATLNGASPWCHRCGDPLA